jgi:hypothetical protein
MEQCWLDHAARSQFGNVGVCAQAVSMSFLVCAAVPCLSVVVAIASRAGLCGRRAAPDWCQAVTQRDAGTQELGVQLFRPARGELALEKQADFGLADVEDL